MSLERLASLGTAATMFILSIDIALSPLIRLIRITLFVIIRHALLVTSLMITKGPIAVALVCLAVTTLLKFPGGRKASCLLPAVGALMPNMNSLVVMLSSTLDLMHQLPPRPARLQLGCHILCLLPALVVTRRWSKARPWYRLASHRSSVASVAAPCMLMVIFMVMLLSFLSIVMFIPH